MPEPMDKPAMSAAAMPPTEFAVVSHKQFLMIHDDFVIGRYPTRPEAELAKRKMENLGRWGVTYSVEERVKGG
jgi:hypothetical protein